MLTQEQLLKSHFYNPTTGLFYKRTKAGQLKQTGSNSHGYLLCGINCQNYLVHRLAWLYMTGFWPDEFIDHIDGNRKNNKWENLRAASNRDNMENLKQAQASNKSTGLLGAYASRDKFKASIQVKGKPKHLGTFDTPEEAHEAYLKAKRELHSFNTL